MSDERPKPESLKSFSLFGNEDPLLGQVFDGRWKLEQLLGDGEISRAYKAEHLQTGEFVTLKILHKHIPIDSANIRRFDATSREIMSLQHHRIARMLDIHLDSEGEIFLVMEYIPGESLEEMFARLSHLAAHRTIEIMSQVCDALEVAHERGLNHHNIRPSNIMLFENAKRGLEVKVTDFGIAKLLVSDESVKSSERTRPKEPLGNPLYASPEQCAGKKTNASADIYALGCTMYESLTGKPPFVGKNVLETAYKHLNELPKPLTPSSVHDKVLSRLEAVIFKCLQKDPKDRYQSAAQLKSDLAILSSATQTQWENDTYLLKKSTKIRKRKISTKEDKRPKLAIIICLLGALLIVALVLIVWLVAFLRSDDSSEKSTPYDNNALWKIQDKAKAAEQADFIGQEESARTELTRAERAGGVNSEEYLKAARHLALIYRDSGHWSDSLEWFRKILKLLPKNAEPIKSGYVNSQLAYIHFVLSENSQAEREAIEAIQAIDASNNPSVVKNFLLLEPLQVLGQIYADSNQLDKAEKMYVRLFSILVINKTKHLNQLERTSARLADVYRRQNKLEQADDLYREAITMIIANEHHNSMFLAKAEYAHGLVLFQENKFKEAQAVLTNALSIRRTRCTNSKKIKRDSF
jgi:serine/threonine protein kinase